MMIKIGAIIVLYNWGQKELENIKSYAKYFDEIILVDNTEKEIDEIELPYRYIKLGKNYGIGRALNEGIKLAKKMNLNYVVTMDQDSTFKSDTAKNYIDIVCSKKFNQSIVLPEHEVEFLKKSKNGFAWQTKLLVQSGAMFNLEMFDSVGLFNEDLFIDVVDYEFGIRAMRQGVKILKNNKIVLIHNPGVEKKKRIFGRYISFVSHNPVRIYYQSRNLFWTAKKYKNSKMFRIYLKLFVKNLLLFDDKRENLRMYFLGTRDAIKNRLGRNIS